MINRVVFSVLTQLLPELPRLTAQNPVDDLHDWTGPLRKARGHKLPMHPTHLMSWDSTSSVETAYLPALYAFQYQRH